MAMMVLSFGVLGILAARRWRAMRRRGLGINRVPVTDHDAARQAEGPLWDPRTIAAGEHFDSLFTFPVIFYSLSLFLLSADAFSPVALMLAWAYVGFRAAQAFVHLTYNLAGHRIAMFGASQLCLFGLFLCAGAAIASNPTGP